MGVNFRQIETGATRSIIGEAELFDLYPPKLKIVPDMTGDGIPDFFEFKEVETHLPGRERNGSFDTVTKMYLTKGAYGKDGRLVKSGDPITLATEQWNSTTGGNVIDVQFMDYNADGLMDVSFWQYVGHGKEFRQVILLSQKP